MFTNIFLKYFAKATGTVIKSISLTSRHIRNMKNKVLFFKENMYGTYIHNFYDLTEIGRTLGIENIRCLSFNKLLY